MTDDDIIDALGGTTAVARLFDISAASVSDWRTRGIPRERLMTLRFMYPKKFGRVIDQHGRRLGHPKSAHCATTNITVSDPKK